MTSPLVVTGVGLVSAAGDSPSALLSAVRAGAPLPSASMEGFDAKRYLKRKGIKDLSRISQLACSAAAANALELTDVAPETIGVVFGTAWGSLKTVVEFEREAHLQGARFVDPILFTETVSNVPAGQVAILNGWSAFNATVSSGEASGSAALRQAVAFLDEERGSVAVAGGGDELNLPLLGALRMRGWAGPIVGEAACFLTVEHEAHARSRGARELASIRATGERFGGSLDELIRHVLSRAGLESREVELVVFAGDGPTDGIREVFGEGPASPPVLFPKSIFGETWGAAGALAAALAIEAMRTSPGPKNALLLDRADAGHQIGLVLTAGGFR